MKLKTIILVGTCLLGSVFQREATCQILPVIPEPVEYKVNEGSFVLQEGMKVLLKGKGSKELSYFLDLMKNRHNISLKPQKGSSKHPSTCQILFTIFPIQGLPNEGYFLKISPQGIALTSSDRAGLFYGIQTLNQLLTSLESKDGTVTIPTLEIRDFPRYTWRGLHLDVSRHFFSKEVIKDYIDYMAMYKMNTFHWHLTDDQGWRIQIKKYPKLTEKGAWRNETLIGHHNQSPREFDKTRYGGYYTQKEIQEIVKYAQSRHITIVPEIEMPGHAQAAISAYPELGCCPEKTEVRKIWGVSEHIFNVNEETFAFLEDVLDEVCKLFPGPHIHLGGDEALKTQWKNSPAIQKRMKELSIKDEAQLQSYFMERMGGYLKKKGKKMIGWDEILEGGLPKGAAVMSWRGDDGGIKAARLQHPVVMSPGAPCYFDHYQANPETEPLAIHGFNPLKRVYLYNPEPDKLTAEDKNWILGAQANMWTEYIKDEKQLEYMLFPRLAAFSEVVWSPQSKRSWNSFQPRIQSHLKWYEDWGINYSSSTIQEEWPPQNTTQK